METRAGRSRSRRRNDSGSSHASENSFQRPSSRASVCGLIDGMGADLHRNRSRSTTPFLRSQCHSKNCHEGHGIEFRNRISPSPKRQSRNTRENSYTFHSANKSEKTQTNGMLQTNATYQTSKTSNIKIITSDYGSSEDDLHSDVKSKFESTRVTANDSKISLGLNVSRSPIIRTEEKTNYTYAESRSYRSSVTPTRVVYMPNMSRTTLQSRGGLYGGNYASPFLRETSNNGTVLARQGKLVESRETVEVQRSGIQCGPDSESDLEMEADLSSYHLSSHSSTFTLIAKYYIQKAKFKIWSFVSLIGWLLYQAVCNLIWLDTHILTSRPISAFRSYVRQHWKSIFSFLFLSLCLLPLIAGPVNFALLPPASQNSTAAVADPLAKTEPRLTETEPRLTFPEPSTHKPVTDESLEVLESVQKPLEQRNFDETEIALLKQNIIDLSDKVKLLEGELRTQKNAVPSLERKLSSLFGFSQTECCKDLTSELDQWKSEINNLVLANKAHENKFALMSSKYSENDKEIKRLANLLEQIENSQQHVSVNLDEILSRISSLEESSGKFSSELESLRFLKEREDRHDLAISGRGMSADEIKALIKAAIAVYDADKTGMADYALEPSGGVILSTRCTETFSYRGAVLSILGIPVWNRENNPRVVIQPGIVPSQCWSFRGPEGYLVIQLSRKITPTAFSMEHIPKSLAPDGVIDSAPKNFSVWGLEHEKDSRGVLLGNYVYDSNGEPLQTFPVEKPSGVFSVVELRIHSNQGNLNYTCLYRFRVHGRPAKT